MFPGAKTRKPTLAVNDRWGGLLQSVWNQYDAFITEIRVSGAIFNSEEYPAGTNAQ
jgi:hypothetical protein